MSEAQKLYLVTAYANDYDEQNRTVAAYVDPASARLHCLRAQMVVDKATARTAGAPTDNPYDRAGGSRIAYYGVEVVDFYPHFDAFLESGDFPEAADDWSSLEALPDDQGQVCFEKRYLYGDPLTGGEAQVVVRVPNPSGHERAGDAVRMRCERDGAYFWHGRYAKGSPVSIKEAGS